jgi:hypothetical protein
VTPEECLHRVLNVRKRVELIVMFVDVDVISCLSYSHTNLASRWIT